MATGSVLPAVTSAVGLKIGNSGCRHDGGGLNFPYQALKLHVIGLDKRP